MVVRKIPVKSAKNSDYKRATDKTFHQKRNSPFKVCLDEQNSIRSTKDPQKSVLLLSASEKNQHQDSREKFEMKKYI